MRRHSDLYSRRVHSKTPLGHPYIYEQGDSNFELGEDDEGTFKER